VNAHPLHQRPVHVAGIGLHRYQRRSGTSYAQLGVTAVRAALDDAGICWPDVDAAVVGSALLGMAPGRIMLARLGATGLSIHQVENVIQGVSVTVQVARTLLHLLHVEGDSRPREDELADERIHAEVQPRVHEAAEPREAPCRDGSRSQERSSARSRRDGGAQGDQHGEEVEHGGLGPRRSGGCTPDVRRPPNGSSSGRKAAMTAAPGPGTRPERESGHAGRRSTYHPAMNARSLGLLVLLAACHREAEKHASAMRRHREEVAASIERLERAQDDLLDNLQRQK